MKKLTASLAVTAGALALSAAAASVAAPAMAATAPSLPVTVTTEDGGVQVYSGIPGQPLVGASVDSHGVCVGFSYQVTNCVGPIE